jgi:hypothetical protein
MTVEQDLWAALKRIENRDLSPEDRNLLRPAFAALHGAQAIKIPERVVARIRHLDATFSKERQ